MDKVTKGPSGKPSEAKPVPGKPDPVQQMATAAGPVRAEVETALRNGRSSGGEH